MKKLKIFSALLPLAMLTACGSSQITVEEFQKQAENLVGKEVKISGVLAMVNQDGSKAVLLNELPQQGQKPEGKPEGKPDDNKQGQKPHGKRNFGQPLEVSFAKAVNKDSERKQVVISGTVKEQRITLEDVEKMEKEFLEKHPRPQRPDSAALDTSRRMPPPPNGHKPNKKHGEGNCCDGQPQNPDCQNAKCNDNPENCPQQGNCNNQQPPQQGPHHPGNPDGHSGATKHSNGFDRLKKQIEESGKGYISRYYIENAQID